MAFGQIKSTIVISKRDSKRMKMFSGWNSGSSVKYGSPGYCQTSQDAFLPVGDSVQAEITAGGKLKKSPVFTP
jgi:hypothetical protein